jgi:hypothetical protein
MIVYHSPTELIRDLFQNETVSCIVFGNRFGEDNVEELLVIFFEEYEKKRSQSSDFGYRRPIKHAKRLG